MTQNHKVKQVAQLTKMTFNARKKHQVSRRIHFTLPFR